MGNEREDTDPGNSLEGKLREWRNSLDGEVREEDAGISWLRFLPGNQGGLFTGI